MTQGHAIVRKWNELTRILRKCSPNLEWKEVAGKMSYFMRKMQFSGYSHEFRHRVVVKALQRNICGEGLLS